MFDQNGARPAEFEDGVEPVRIPCARASTLLRLGLEDPNSSHGGTAGRTGGRTRLLSCPVGVGLGRARPSLKPSQIFFFSLRRGYRDFSPSTTAIQHPHETHKPSPRLECTRTDAEPKLPPRAKLASQSQARFSVLHACMPRPRLRRARTD